MPKEKLNKMPHTITVVKKENVLELIHSLSSKNIKIPLAITGAFFLFFVGDIRSGTLNLDAGNIITVIAYVIFMAIGLEMFLRKTHVYINRGSVSVKYKPYSLFKRSKEIKSHEIKQAYVQKVKVSSTKSRNSSSYSRPYDLYKLMIQKRDGTETELLNFAKDYQSARAIEQEIESFLKIEDESVSGEVFDFKVSHYPNLMK